MDYKPLVSIWMVTYNHEKFIGQALESVINQKTSFPIEVIIGEDCSTDGTRAIIQLYEQKYPEIIKPIYHDKNVGATRNAYEFCFPKLRGKYIACLEGDDFWVDPLKLQKQTNFLEENPDYMISFHRVNKLFESNGHIEPTNMGQKTENTIEDLFVENFICTASCMFRNGYLTKFPDFFFQNGAGDWVLHLLNAQYGKINFMEDIMAVYRIHSSGAISTAVSTTSKLKIALLNDIQTFNNLDQFFHLKYTKLVKKLTARIYKQLAILYIQENNRKEAFRHTCISLNLFFSISTAVGLLPTLVLPQPNSAYKIYKTIKKIGKF